MFEGGGGAYAPSGTLFSHALLSFFPPQVLFLFLGLRGQALVMDGWLDAWSWEGFVLDFHMEKSTVLPENPAAKSSPRLSLAFLKFFPF